MSNQKRLEEYLVGDNGYLKSDISNGKVIMLSGKWGSGKTHFWQNIIATDKFKEELSSKNSAYSYVSLYGKSSIEEIENDIFSQTYFSAIGGDNLVTKTFSTFTKYSKRYGEIFSNKLKNLANGLEEEQNENQERVALERLKNAAIICFDDFERKSKDIDLNDLFGFITQLTLNFNCKVVIILNDDVFEGEEKKIFSNVKEKSVSKFLKYEPSIKDLFDSMFDSDKEYRKLDDYKEIILKTIEETEELNARIYIQVLDNLVEWIKNQEKSDEVLRCLILVNINFVLYHNIIDVQLINYKHKIMKINIPSLFSYSQQIKVNPNMQYPEYLNKLKGLIYSKEKENNNLKGWYNSKNLTAIEINKIVDFIDNNENDFRSIYFTNKLDISRNINDETFQKINNFIETGILINE